MSSVPSHDLYQHWAQANWWMRNTHHEKRTTSLHSSKSVNLSCLHSGPHQTLHFPTPLPLSSQSADPHHTQHELLTPAHQIRLISHPWATLTHLLFARLFLCNARQSSTILLLTQSVSASGFFPWKVSVRESFSLLKLIGEDFCFLPFLPCRKRGNSWIIFFFGKKKILFWIFLKRGFWLWFFSRRRTFN